LPPTGPSPYVGEIHVYPPSESAPEQTLAFQDIPQSTTKESLNKAICTDIVPSPSMKTNSSAIERDTKQKIGLHARVIHLVHSASFDYVSASLVLTNAVTIGLQTDYMARHVLDTTPRGYRIVDAMFCIAFTIEIFLRMVALGPQFIFGGGWKWNLFDSLLVGMQLVDEILSTMAESIFSGGFNFSFMRVLRIFRLIRIIRIIRILRLIGELRTIVSSIMGSLKSLAWTVVLLFLLVYVFGVYFTQLVLDHRLSLKGDTVEPSPSLQSLEFYFGSLGRSILSLYQAISGGVDWDDLAVPLISRISALVGFVVALYVAFAMLALLNVVTGVFVESALKSAKEDRDMYMLQHMRSLFSWADTDKNGTLSWSEFERQLQNPNMEEFFASIDVDLSEAEGVFRLLDNDESGEIDLDEFLNGCLGLHGPAKAIHLSTLMYEARNLHRNHSAHAERMEAFMQALVPNMDVAGGEREPLLPARAGQAASETRMMVPHLNERLEQVALRGQVGPGAERQKAQHPSLPGSID